jgi:peptidoglycan/xylan/chitin deacetylase (PgdA/CDA1 family)
MAMLTAGYDRSWRGEDDTMKIVLAFLFALAPTAVFGASPHTFAWPDGRQAAIALTYDDGLQSQLDVAIPQLDAAGLKGTFFLNGTFALEDLARWRAAAAEGHELGNHTVFHPCRSGAFKMPRQYNTEIYTVETMLEEIRVMNTFLFAIDGRTARAYAVPCDRPVVGHNKDYIKALRASGLVRFVRQDGAWDKPNVLDPTRRIDPFNVPCQFFDEPRTGARLIDFVEQVRRSGGFGVMGFHGVGGDYLTTSAEAHKALVDYLAAHQHDIWIAPFSELMDYVVAHSKDVVR